MTTQRRVRSAVLALALAGVSTTVGLVGTAGPAAATPSKCVRGAKWETPAQAWYRCDGGTGYYRTLAYCASQPAGWGSYVYGPWRGAGSGLPSNAFCSNSQPYLVDYGYEKKG